MKEIEKVTNNKKILYIVIGVVVLIIIIGSFFIDFGGSSRKGPSASVTIIKGGTYDIKGKSTCVSVKTNESVTLNLNNTTMNCSKGPAINIEEADDVKIVLTGENTITSTTTEALNGAIYSKSDLEFSGEGNLAITSNYDGIVSKDDLVITSGVYTIKADDDGIRGKDSVEITDGTFDITAGGDGIKSTNEEDTTKGYITINGGEFTINSEGDGIQSVSNLNIKDGDFTIKTSGSSNSKNDSSISSKALKSSTLITIDGGKFNIDSVDDAVHTNGNVVINNGEFTINSLDDAIHANDTLTINDGKINTLKCYEGFEASKVYIKGGDNSIVASDDGINAASSDSSADATNSMNGKDKFKESTGLIEISGGVTKVVSQGDGLDSNGTITISGGEIYVESSNQGPEEAIDHIGELTVNSGTIVSVSKNSANDDGTKTSNVPYVNTSVSNGSGEISIGEVTYTPTTSGYKYIFIASNKLSSGENTLKYGDNTESVTLNTGVVNNIGGGMGTPGSQGGPGGPGRR